MKLFKKEFSFPSILLASSMFFTGAAGMIAQFILAVTASIILGSSHTQYALTICLMMGFMGAGGYMQKYVTNNLVTKFVIIEVLLSLLMGFSAIGLMAAYVYLPNYVEIVQCIWIALMGFFIGFEIPLITRVNETYSPKLKNNIGLITAMDYIGGMFGGFVWVYFFLGKMPLATVAFIAAGFNLAVATTTFFYFARSQRFKAIVVQSCVLLAILITLFAGYKNAENMQVSLKQGAHEDPIVYEKLTPYQDIVVTYSQKTDDTRCYINGNLQLSSLDEQRYHEHLVIPALETQVKRDNVLILGGGDGMALREVLKYKDVRSVELVDLDAEMIRLFKEDPVLAKLNSYSYADARVSTSSPELEVIGTMPVYEDFQDSYTQKDVYRKVSDVQVYTMDAALFVQESKRKLYNVIIIDFPDPSSTELAKLYTEEFFISVKNMLAPGGAISIQATSPYHAKESYLCIKRTMEAAGLQTLPYHHNIPSFGDWGWFLAWNDASCSVQDIKNLLATEFQIQTSYLTPEVLAASMVFGKGALETASTHVNTILHPILVADYEQESWLIE